MTRGALYMVWPGDPRTDAMLKRSIASLEATNSGLNYEVIRLDEGSLLDKPRMYQLTPYQCTLFLDADTVVLGNLDFAFEKAEIHGLACCICECPWARRYPALADRTDAIEYNTGVLAFTKGAADVFHAWYQNVAVVDSSIEFVLDGEVTLMPHNDQAGFALAIEQTGFNPFVLPMQWNFRGKWQLTSFGPVRIWHEYADVPKSILDWNAQHPPDNRVISCGRFA